MTTDSRRWQRLPLRRWRLLVGGSRRRRIGPLLRWRVVSRGHLYTTKLPGNQQMRETGHGIAVGSHT